MLPERVTTVLFDVGNTLHHLDHAYLAAVISRHSHPVDARRVQEVEYAAKAEIDAQLRAARSGNDSTRQLSYFEVIMNELAVPEDARAGIGADLRAENQRDSLWRVMHPETPRVLRRLDDRGFALGVVSNADGRVPAALAASGLAPFFRAIVDSHLVGVEKPDPRIFGIALDRCGAVAAETVYIGDIYEIDVQGARGAGITPILLDPLGGYGDVDCLQIDSLERLLDLLPEMAR